MMEQKEQNNRETSEQDISLLVEEDGFEPSKLTQQIYSLPPLATRELLHMNLWSWWTDSNPRPADYKSAALPTELHQRRVLRCLTARLNITRSLKVVKQITKNNKNFLFGGFGRWVAVGGEAVWNCV